MASTPSPAQLRQLIFKFYQAVDPTKLQMGLDINGIVEWTMRNGVDALNMMLMKQFGKTINFDENLTNAKENFKRVSMGLSLSTQIAKQEHETRMTLAKYFTVHDKTMIDKSQEEQFDKLVKFAMLNGMDKLSQKLEQKYKASVTSVNASGKNSKNGVTAAAANSSAQQTDFGHSGANTFGLDKERLRADLRSFYEEMEDEEQLEVLDELTDWACQIGIDEFNKKVEQLYGQSLNEYLREKKKPIHVNKTTTATNDTSENKPTMNKMASTAEESDEEEEDEEEEEEEEEGEEEKSDFGNEKPSGTLVAKQSFEEADKADFGPEFDDMTDEELSVELKAFYQRHDPDNLEQLDQVCELARKLGRTQLNAKLKDIYHDILSPVNLLKSPEKSKPKGVVSVMNVQNNRPPGLGFQTGNSLKYHPGVVPDDDTELPLVPPRITVNNRQSGNTENSSVAIQNMSGIFSSNFSSKFQGLAVLDELEKEDETGDQVLDGKNMNKPTKVAYNTDPVITLENESVSNKKTEDVSETQTEDVLAKERKIWKETEVAPKKETEFQRIAREKAERNQGGRSRIHVDGKIIEKNILLDVCNKYRLDVFSGICVCGFSKADHNDNSKYSVNGMLDSQKTEKKNVKNSKGLMNVKNLAKNLNHKETSPKTVSTVETNLKAVSTVETNKKKVNMRKTKKKNWGPA